MKERKMKKINKNIKRSLIFLLMLGSIWSITEILPVSAVLTNSPNVDMIGDNIAPTTEISGVTAGGFYDNNVTIILTAIDNPGGSGINNTFYIMNFCLPLEGGNCLWYGGETIYDKPIDVNSNGNYSINFWSVDKAGNIEHQKTVNFTLKHSINIISPNGGENWKAGTTQNIQWKYTGGDDWPYIQIELLKGDSTEFIITPTVIPRGTNGIGSYNWTIPAIATSNDYKIRITDTPYPTAVALLSISTDTSDSNFTISQNPNISSNLYVSMYGSNETISGKYFSIKVHVDQDCILPGSDIVTKCPAQSVEINSSFEGIIYYNFLTTDNNGNMTLSYMPPITTIPKVEIININASKPPNLYGNLSVPMNIILEEANMPVNISISDFEMPIGGNITIPIRASVPIGENISAVGMVLSYNPDIITVSNVTSTNFPNLNVSNGFIPGDILIDAANSTGVSGDFSIVDVQFNAVSSTGTSPITISPHLVHDNVGLNLTSIVRNGNATVTGPPILAKVVIDPISIKVKVNNTVNFTTKTFDQFNNIFPVNVTWTWFSSNTSVGTIDTKGLFKALSPGKTIVLGYNGTVSNNSSVTVMRIILKGDANGDEVIDVGDVLYIAQAVAGIRELDPDTSSLSDVDDYSGLTVGDVLFVAQALSGLRSL